MKWIEKKWESFKLKFRRAIFGWFRDEIMESYKRNHCDTLIRSPYVIEDYKIDIQQLKIEMLIASYNEEEYHMNYDRSLRMAKEKLFNEAMKYLEVDVKSIFDEQVFTERKITASLFVGKTKKL